MQRLLTDKLVVCFGLCHQDLVCQEVLSSMLLDIHVHLRRVCFWRNTHCIWGSLQQEYQWPTVRETVTHCPTKMTQLQISATFRTWHNETDGPTKVPQLQISVTTARDTEIDVPTKVLQLQISATHSTWYSNEVNGPSKLTQLKISATHNMWQGNKWSY